MVVVDTTVWIDFFRGTQTREVERFKDLLRSGVGVALTDIVYMELLQGARDQRQAEKLRRRLIDFPILRLERLSDFGLAADLNRAARLAGITLRNRLDYLIAAVCVRDAVPILHSDADFDRLATCTELRIFGPA